MSVDMVERVANAVLYEGYMLYPYTSTSVKNRQRWNFGVLSPPAYDTCEMQTECLIVGDASVHVKVRFLQDTGRATIERVVELVGVTRASPKDAGVDFNPIEGIVDARLSALPGMPPNTALSRLTVRVSNRTPVHPGSREEALASSMLSTHTILTLTSGDFVSMIDPPVEYREAAAGCRNVATFPVLAGVQGERDCILSSPIILYDYPQIAPESPGDLFDALEIDEILTLRILTLSDQEKAEIREGDERARAVLERSECMPPEQLMKLHGALRGLRPSSGSKEAVE
jgi:hypothetical protein